MAKKNKAKKWKKRQRQLEAMMAANGAATAQPQQGQSLMAGLSRLLPGRPSEQFLVGALIGAAAAYVLSDEELRGKLIKSGLSLYGTLAGGLAEMKEQVADLQAELQAEQAAGL
ncbi:YtxH domain-containing protein [Azospirillum sp. TSO22-1]|uniref:YtxH domain-containing protein n=1 Tax=Azospirillum sp. TSO22-1 TaxID=716789 RepID=UPI000D619603|nr:YtxH domain-containing protein [Azospirillum sp. TSO22-1]PWC44242.1 hypothetical protein TSO221_18270 [Azospirillum sp. TSO22-1]